MTWTFSFISHTPTDPCVSHTCYPPISPVPFHVPYFPELPPYLYIFSMVLYFTWGGLSVTHMGIGHRLLFDAPQNCLVVCL